MYMRWNHGITCASGLLGVLLVSPLPAAEQRTFTSSKYGYRLRLPKTWNVSVSANGIPIFFNYDPKDALPQGLFPEHGVDIRLIPFAVVQPITKGDSLKEWIQFNSALGYSNMVIRQLPTPNRSERTPVDVVVVHADYQRDPQDEVWERATDYYFTLHGERFRLMLEYWKGDPQSAYFESVVDSIFRSIESR
jgi:hypothetical protein